MSDTSRHDEIEDVLSSIRRLVADGPEQPSPRRGRLVLTPALRVPQEDTEGVEAAPDEMSGEPSPAPEEGASPAPAARAGDPSLAERIAELEAVVAGYDDDDEQGEIDVDAAPPPRAGTPAWRAAVFPRAADAAIRHGGRRDGDDDIALTPDGGGEAADSHGPDAVDGAAGGSDHAGMAGQGGTANADAPPMEEEGPAGINAAGAGGAPEAGTGADAEAESDKAAAGNAHPGPEAQVLDEAALREIVAEIVREELQGRLGERITRNVRKLVRQEINRALTSRDFE